MKLSVIESAEKRLDEEVRQNNLGADNDHDIRYWANYLDGAREQKKEDESRLTAEKEAEKHGMTPSQLYVSVATMAITTSNLAALLPDKPELKEMADTVYEIYTKLAEETR